MVQFSRLLRRWSLFRASALTLAAAWLLVLAAYLYYAANSRPGPSSIAAAAVLLVIGATSFLYAWREPGA